MKPSLRHNGHRQASIRQRSGPLGQVLLPDAGLPAHRHKKSLGQHFLMHARIAGRIVAAAGLKKEETVLEIGPGRGILTAALLEAGARVVAVEADAALLPGLEERFAAERASGVLTLIHADIRTYLAGPAPELGSPYAVVANIPYYLTGELIRMLLERQAQPTALTLLVQKEVAERIVANPKRGRGARSLKESLLSLSVKAYGEPRYAFTVPKGAFVPAPKVDSAVLTVTGISRGRFAGPGQEARFFALIRAGFAHKRKLLRSNLAAAGFTREAGLVGQGRAEDVALDEWLALAAHGPH